MSLSDEATHIASAVTKLVATWGLTAWGVLTLHNIALALAAALSALQIYVLVRDRILHRRGHRQ